MKNIGWRVYTSTPSQHSRFPTAKGGEVPPTRPQDRWRSAKASATTAAGRDNN